LQTLWLKSANRSVDTQPWAQDKTPDKGQNKGQSKVPEASFEAPATTQTERVRETLLQLSTHLDQELEHILDPFGVFGSNSNLKGLESTS